MTSKPSEKQPPLKRLISLDIDGTMEFGDPPGGVTVQWVKQAKEQGYVIGSASDRPLSDQRRIWEENGITLDFIILKHWLEELRTSFQVDEYWHVGDSPMDQVYAAQARFTFFWAEDFPQEMHTYVNGDHGGLGLIDLKFRS